MPKNVDLFRHVEKYVDEYVDLPVERVVVNNEYSEKLFDVPFPNEVIKEVVENVYVDKEIRVRKIVEKPQFIPRYVDKYVDKVVELRVEIENPVFVESYHENIVDVPVQVQTTVERLNVREKRIPVEMNSLLTKNLISQAQINRFEKSSVQLAKVVEENLRLKGHLEGTKELLRLQSQSSLGVTTQEVSELKQKISRMESELSNSLRDYDRLRDLVAQGPQIEIVNAVDSQDIAALRENIRIVREENERLRRITSQGRFGAETIPVGSEVVEINHYGGIGEHRHKAPRSKSRQSRASNTASTGGLYGNNLVNLVNPMVEGRYSNHVSRPLSPSSSPLRRSVGGERYPSTSPGRVISGDNYISNLGRGVTSYARSGAYASGQGVRADNYTSSIGRYAGAQSPGRTIGVNNYVGEALRRSGGYTNAPVYTNSTNGYVSSTVGNRGTYESNPWRSTATRIAEEAPRLTNYRNYVDPKDYQSRGSNYSTAAGNSKYLSGNVTPRSVIGRN